MIGFITIEHDFPEFELGHANGFPGKSFQGPAFPVPRCSDCGVKMRTYLSARDCRCLLSMIDQLYALPDREKCLQLIFEELKKLVPYSSAVYIAMNSSGLFRTEGHSLVGVSEKLLSAFTDHYAAVHPFTTSGWVHHTNAAARITDFVPAYRLFDTEYGRDFLSTTPCSQELGVIMGAQGDHVGALCLHRQKLDRTFSDRDLQVINYLAPHMARVINHFELLDTIQSDHLSSDAGLLEVRPGGEVIANEMGRKILEATPGLLSEIHPTQHAAFLKTSKGVYRLRKTLGGIGEGQRILLEPLPHSETLQQRLSRWNFTDRQREVVLKVIRGDSNKEIAMSLSVSEQTVKEHVKNIFDKVGVRSRAKLISGLFSSQES